MAQPASITRAAVFDALDEVVENGFVENFDFSGKSIYDVDPHRILVDLNRCDADFDDLSDPADEKLVLLLISDWQYIRKPKKTFRTLAYCYECGGSCRGHYGSRRPV